MKQTVIHHSADYDGIFCREIARKFMPDAELIGWDFGNPQIEFPSEGDVYVLDLPPSCIKGADPDPKKYDRRFERLIWIDHHASAISEWPEPIEGYRIDGVSACRLAWQYFGARANNDHDDLPMKDDYTRRNVREPLAVMLAGEYDVWDHLPSNGDDITFQYGLDSVPELDWKLLLATTDDARIYTIRLLNNGIAARQCYRNRDTRLAIERGFDLEWEGLKFRVLNTASRGSGVVDGAVRPEHDAAMVFCFTGELFVISMYGAPGKPDIDLSKIAVKYGGGGHKQACGFQARTLPWIDSDQTIEIDGQGRVHR